MTLDEFLNQTKIRNSDVTFPNFITLYVRKSWWAERTIELARIHASPKGAGNWTKLITHLRSNDWGIIVESVVNDRFFYRLSEDKDGFGWELFSTRCFRDSIAQERWRL